MDFLNKLFGFPSRPQPPAQSDERPEIVPEPHGRFFPSENFEDSRLHRRHFNVFSDPLEIHRYFEEQMGRLMSSFGFPGSESFFHAFEHPSIDAEQTFDNSLEQSSPLSRDHFLKKGYDRPSYQKPSADRLDKDLDGKLDTSELESLFTTPADKKPLVPHRNNELDLFEPSRTFSGIFNKSVQMKTIRSPDGITETRKVITDSDGNQETTITRRVGDKEYTIIKKRDKEGKEEVQENMINMSEEDKSLFGNVQPSSSYFDHSLFGKFFK